MSGLIVNGAAEGSYFLVTGTAAGTPVTFNGGAGPNNVDVQAGANGLADFAADVTVNGGGGADTMSVHDDASWADGTYTITSDSIQRTGSAQIVYRRIPSVQLFGGMGSTTYNIESTAAGTSLEVDAPGEAAETFNISPTAQNLNTIAGNLTIYSEGFVSPAPAALNVDDQANARANTYTLSPGAASGTTITRTGSAAINVLGGFTGIVVNGGSGTDVYDVQGVFGVVAAVLNTGGGRDAVNLADVNSVGDPLTINGQGVATLNVTGQTTDFAVTSSALGLGGQVSYQGLRAINVNADAPNLYVYVYGTAAGTAVSINAGANANFQVGSADGSLAQILGPLALTSAGTASLSFDVDANLNPSAGAYTLTGSSLRTDAGAVSIHFSGIANLYLYTGTGNNTVTLAAPLPAMPVLLDALGGTNTLIGPKLSSAWDVTGENSGTLGNVTFSGFQNLTSGSGGDGFVIGPGGGLSGSLNGGGGSSVDVQSALTVTPGASLEGVRALTVEPGASLNDQGTVVIGAPGTTAGSLTNNGLIDLGLATTLAVNGGYVQGGSGTLLTELLNTGSYGKLAVAATASLAGTLSAQESPGFSTAIGDQFNVLSYATVDGFFATENLALPAPLGFNPQLGSTALALTTTGPVSIAATAGAGQSVRVATGFGQSLAATVYDQFGHPVAGATVTFTAPAGVGVGASGTFSNGKSTMTVTTDSIGQASVTFKANTRAGSYQVTASVGGVSLAASFTLTNKAGAPAHVVVTSGSGQTATVAKGFTKPLVVTVTDKYGNPVAGAKVTFTAPASGASGTFGKGVGSITVTTAANGQASASLKANTRAGSYQVTASVNGISIPANFALTNTAGAATTLTIVQGSGQSAPLNAAFAQALEVQVTDRYGNAVVGEQVTFTAPSSGPSGTFASGLVSVTVLTGAGGIVVAPTFTAGPTTGSYNMTAAVAGLQPVQFGLTDA
jgi:hypothetical protein